MNSFFFIGNKGQITIAVFSLKLKCISFYSILNDDDGDDDGDDDDY